MTTINDIAKLAGVSRSTVSRYLNSNGYVSEDATQKITKAIEETGYLPSQSAKSLRTKKSGVIGVILPKISTETASRVITGVNKVLQSNHYQMLLTDTSLESEKEIEFIRLLQSRHVDGILLLGTNQEPALIQAIEEANVPIIVLGQEIAETISVTYPDYEATQTMIEYFIEQHYQRIGFIGVDPSDPAVGQIRKQAYEDTLKKHQLPMNENWVQIGDFSIESGYQAMQTILERSTDETPDAVFVVTDRMAVGAMQCMKEHQLQIPADIAIATTGASTLSQYIEPSLTTIDFLNEEAGEKATELLLEAINGKCPQKKLMHNYRLLKRDSV
ncbi:LacI family transcriptional regulator [Gracilibacillus halophilus YIM-C55.5]|uniref:LacI family transcriptional regulator n=1 Tax=Gracilibacillus halophilus YIM-C55.5 TaxID=1308866 RepID=N4WQC3_9BACI|nr:substrate-binding domain-containing protein [Gracilibacillus halophilus]ENH96655.1 LacI family transcriptional regulator [Gracilibacillus halophilus YIM-C55.5]